MIFQEFVLKIDTPVFRHPSVSIISSRYFEKYHRNFDVSKYGVVEIAVCSLFRQLSKYWVVETKGKKLFPVVSTVYMSKQSEKLPDGKTLRISVLDLD